LEYLSAINRNLIEVDFTFSAEHLSEEIFLKFLSFYPKLTDIQLTFMKEAGDDDDFSSHLPQLIVNHCSDLNHLHLKNVCKVDLQVITNILSSKMNNKRSHLNTNAWTNFFIKQINSEQIETSIYAEFDPTDESILCLSGDLNSNDLVDFFNRVHYHFDIIVFGYVQTLSDIVLLSLALNRPHLPKIKIYNKTDITALYTIVGLTSILKYCVNLIEFQFDVSHEISQTELIELFKIPNKIEHFGLTDENGSAYIQFN
jgi:hypothetical protein